MYFSSMFILHSYKEFKEAYKNYKEMKDVRISLPIISKILNYIK